MAISNQKIQEAALRKRIEQYYELLNQREFARCHEMIDPRVRSKSSSVTLLQYENSLRDFLAALGSINIETINIVLHLNEPSPLYEDRDFAVGEIRWKDEDGKHRTFSERWVQEDRTWFTRSTGFMVPADAKLAVSSKSTERSRVVDLNNLPNE